MYIYPCSLIANPGYYGNEPGGVTAILSETVTQSDSEIVIFLLEISISFRIQCELLNIRSKVLVFLKSISWKNIYSMVFLDLKV